MSQTQRPGRQAHTFINPNSGAEIARQMSFEPLLSQAMGGLFSEKSNLTDVHYVLDIYCGPGSWALEVAFHYPHLEVIAIDSNLHMVEYARAQAKVQGLNNVHFRHMDPRCKLDFPDGIFDIVNARFISSYLRTEDWSHTIAEFYRISQPGAIIRLIESDEPFISNSAACERLKLLYTQALALNGQSFHPFEDSTSTGLTPQLGKFLYDSGYQTIQERAYVVNFSPHQPNAYLKYDNLKVLYKLGQPFLCKMSVATQEELDELYEQMLIDLLTSDFRALWYILSCWGYKS